ncbi:P-loop NTPase family protein [Acetobacter papayae]|uniref:hypothetical protein n=1 Tax=Acetobacter papayae TaxID=1076592 RepID=UPI001F322717|nr:hypothetical protein [Acetobacter papayae]
MHAAHAWLASGAGAALFHGSAAGTGPDTIPATGGLSGCAGNRARQPGSGSPDSRADWQVAAHTLATPPQKGRMLVAGEDVTHQPPGLRHVASCGVHAPLFGHLSVLDNIVFPLRHAEYSSRTKSCVRVMTCWP